MYAYIWRRYRIDKFAISDQATSGVGTPRILQVESVDKLFAALFVHSGDCERASR